MQYIISEINFRHFKLLRKAIMHKKTGVLQFQTIDGFHGFLLFKCGDMHATKKNKQLIKFLTYPLKTISWEDKLININRTSAIEVITNAMNHIQWSDAYLCLISKMFTHFSHLNIIFVPVKFKNSLTDLSYHLFYQRITSNRDYCVSNFMLKNNPANPLLMHRVRIVTFNYLLGLIRTNKGSLGVKSLTKQLNGSNSTIKRIMKRLQRFSPSS